jgi:hypothetical protein
MKLSNETLSVLKNFANINSGIEFKQGNKIATMSQGKTVLAKATLKDDFPQTFCVYDLNQFLSVHSLNKDTEIDFDDANVIFKSGRSKIKYRKTEKTMIVTPPEKSLTLPSVDVEFTLTEDDMNQILKTASVLQSPHISVESDGDKIFLTTYNAADNSAHTNSIEVSEGNGNKFHMVFLTDNLKMITGTYDVQISSKGLSLFKNKNVDIEYFVATESKFSKYGE